MMLKIIFWVCLSIFICASVHYAFCSINRGYGNKKIKYLGEFEKNKYQELIDELKKIEQPINEPTHNILLEPELSNEIMNMKQSLIELMNSEMV